MSTSCGACRSISRLSASLRAHDTCALAHLVRYLLRPSFSLARLALRDDGAVLYRLRKPDKKGRSVLVLTPLQLLARLAAILPAPRFALRREIGLFAPGAKLRRKVVPTPPPHRRPLPRQQSHQHRVATCRRRPLACHGRTCFAAHSTSTL